VLFGREKRGKIRLPLDPYTFFHEEGDGQNYWSTQRRAREILNENIQRCSDLSNENLETVLREQIVELEDITP